MKKRIFILAHYSHTPLDKNFNVSLACCQKVSYLSKLLCEQGYDVSIVSLVGKRSQKIVPNKKIYNQNGVEIIYPGFSASRFVFLRKLINRIVFTKTINFLKSQRPENIIVYHSLSLCKKYSILRKKTNSKLIIEVEELYSDLPIYSKYWKLEKKSLSFANSFICITPSLFKKIGYFDKSHCFYYGPYSPTMIREKLTDAFHIVYAGTIEKDKGNFELLLKTAHELPKEYFLHIFPSINTDKTKKIIQEAFAKIKTQCTIVLEKSSYGEQLDEYISRFHVGLNLQDNTGTFNESSFPSKILLYLRNNLHIIATKSSSLLDSPFKDLVTYCDYNSKSVVERIKEAQLLPYELSSKLLKKIELNFIDDLKKILS